MFQLSHIIPKEYELNKMHDDLLELWESTEEVN